MIKWICAAVGFSLGGFFGAVAGYFIGAVIQRIGSGISGSEYSSSQYARNREYHAYGGNRPYGHRQVGSATDSPRTLFLNSLLEMTAHVIAADGRIMHSEMEVVRAFLRQNFDAATARACGERLLTIFQERKQLTAEAWRRRVVQSCRNVTFALTQEQCLQLMALLAGIAKADGRIDPAEVKAMKDVAHALGMDASVVEQLLSLGGSTLDDAYRVLGVSPQATDDEVRRAYRKMALQYHPDRVSTLGKDVQENAKRKFQEINDAKERIFKARGM